VGETAFQTAISTFSRTNDALYVALLTHRDPSGVERSLDGDSDQRLSTDLPCCWGRICRKRDQQISGSAHAIS
jgi:hypothetical protein